MDAKCFAISYTSNPVRYGVCVSCVCVCIYVYVSACALCAHVCGGQRLTLDVFLSYFFASVFGTGSLPGCGS